MSDNPARKSFRSRKRPQAGAGGTPDVVYAESREHAQALLDDSYLGKFKAVPWDEWERVGLPQEKTHGGAPENGRTLEDLLEAGEVVGGLLLKGEWSDAERRIAADAWRAGVEAGQRSAASETAVPCTCTGHADESGIHFDSSRCARHRAANAAHPRPLLVPQTDRHPRRS